MARDSKERPVVGFFKKKTPSGTITVPIHQGDSVPEGMEPLAPAMVKAQGGKVEKEKEQPSPDEFDGIPDASDIAIAPVSEKDRWKWGIKEISPEAPMPPPGFCSQEAIEALGHVIVSGMELVDEQGEHELQRDAAGKEIADLYEDYLKSFDDERSPDEIDRATKEYEKRRDELLDLMTEHFDETYKIQCTINRVAYEYMSVDTPSNVSPLFLGQWFVRPTDELPESKRSAYFSDAEKESVQKACDIFGKFVDFSQTSTSNVRFGKTPSGRSFYSPDLGAVALSEITGTSMHTIVHELGHWLESTSPGMHSKAYMFWYRRVKDDWDKMGSPQWLGPPYKSDEVGFEDRFERKYSGRYYANSHSTEIVSMGLEMMVSDPLGFALKDPDYFTFMYDLLRGNKNKDYEGVDVGNEERVERVQSGEERPVIGYFKKGNVTHPIHAGESVPAGVEPLAPSMAAHVGAQKSSSQGADTHKPTNYVIRTPEAVRAKDEIIRIGDQYEPKIQKLTVERDALLTVLRARVRGGEEPEGASLHAEEVGASDKFRSYLIRAGSKGYDIVMLEDKRNEKIFPIIRVKDPIIAKFNDDDIARIPIDNPFVSYFHTKDIEGGMDAFRSLVSSKVKTPSMYSAVRIGTQKDYSTHYQPKIRKILLHPAVISKQAVAHELGHWLELNNSRINESARAFLQRRTAEDRRRYNNTPQQLIEEYGDSVVGYKDKFITPYTGRVYKDNIATEVVSTGIELMVKDPYNFAKNDPDHFTFIYDILRGAYGS